MGPLGPMSWNSRENFKLNIGLRVIHAQEVIGDTALDRPSRKKETYVARKVT